MRYLVLVLVMVPAIRTGAAEPERVRVMTFNLWHGGEAGKQPLERSAAVIRAAEADLVGLQETAGLAANGNDRPDNAARLAKLLGWNYLDQGGRTGIITRFKIVAATPTRWGAKVELSSGRVVYHFNAHFAPAPYQPYQLLSIPYGDGRFLKTEAEAIAAARQARGGQVARLLADIKAVLPSETPAFVTGDFNEPSHLDWTDAAMKAKHCPIRVAWPTTRAVAEAGFVDAYRAVHTDPVRRPGLTWTPTTDESDPKDRHDRIDFVLVRGPKVAVKRASVVGEKPARADIVVERYPSDHRAVVAEMELGDAGGSR